MNLDRKLTGIYGAETADRVRTMPLAKQLCIAEALREADFVKLEGLLAEDGSQADPAFDAAKGKTGDDSGWSFSKGRKAAKKHSDAVFGKAGDAYDKAKGVVAGAKQSRFVKGVQDIYGNTKRWADKGGQVADNNFSGTKSKSSKGKQAPVNKQGKKSFGKLDKNLDANEFAAELEKMARNNPEDAEQAMDYMKDVMGMKKEAAAKVARIESAIRDVLKSGISESASAGATCSGAIASSMAGSSVPTSPFGPGFAQSHGEYKSVLRRILGDATDNGAKNSTSPNYAKPTPGSKAGIYDQET